MKKYLLVFFLTILFFGSLKAGLCGGDYYLQVVGGANFKPTVKEKRDHFKHCWEYDTGAFAGGALGFKVCDFRMEGELGYRHNKLRSLRMDKFKIRLHNDVTTWSGLANLYYDLPCTFQNIKAYVGGGVGYARSKDHSPHYQPKDFMAVKRGFAWQLIAGISYPVTHYLDLLLEYRYFHTRIEKGANHDLAGGLRIWF